MNLWVIAPRIAQSRLIEPLKDPSYRVFSSETALAAFDAMPAAELRVDAFVVGGFDAAAAVSAVAAIRAHPVVWKHPILVVGESFGTSESIVLNGAGADLCYSLPFVASVYAARVRYLLELAGERLDRKA